MVEPIEGSVADWIAKDQEDPRQQLYMFNVTRGRLIRTNEQYHRARENKDQIKTVSYDEAHRIYKSEENAKKAALWKVIQRKRAKAARKKSRGS